MEYEILKPFCIACGLEVDTPAECDMDLFRLGLPTHNQCLLIVINFLEEYGKLMRHATRIEDMLITLRPAHLVVEGVTVITADGTTTGNLMSDDSIQLTGRKREGGSV